MGFPCAPPASAWQQRRPPLRPARTRRRQAARESVEGVLSRWDKLLAALPEAKRGELTRSMGLKMVGGRRV